MNAGEERSGGPPLPARPLASIVRGEAARADAESRIRADPSRVADGWERRFVLERGRAADLVALYEAGGFEVAVDAVAPELLDDECSDCRLVSRLEYVQIYTRRRTSPAGEQADVTRAEASAAPFPPRAGTDPIRAEAERRRGSEPRDLP